MPGQTKTPGVNVVVLRRVTGVLLCVLGIGLALGLASYSAGGSWHLLVTNACAGLALLGMAIVLFRTRGTPELGQARKMAILLCGLLMLAILAHLLVFGGVAPHLMGGGVLVLTLVSVIILPRQWATQAGVVSVFLLLAGLVEWLKPLPRNDLSVDPTAGFAISLVFLLLLIPLGFLAMRSASMATIRNRLLISFALVALFPGILSAGASVALGLQSSERSILATLDAAANEREARMLEWIEDLQLDLTVTRRLEDAALTTLLTADRDSPEFEAAHAVQQRRFRDSLALRGNFDLLLLMDRTGTVLLTSGPLDVSGQAVSDEGVKAILAAAARVPFARLLLLPFLQTASTGAGANAVPGAPTITIALPVMDEYGELRGVLAGQAGFAPIAAMVARRQGLTEGYTAYLVNAEGLLVPTGDPGSPGQQPGSPGQQPGSPGQQPGSPGQGLEALLITRDRHSGRSVNQLGETVFGDYRWIPGLEVGLVIEAQPDALIRTTLATVGVNVALTVFSVGLAMVASISIAHGIARPLVDAADAATAVAGGDLNRMIRVERSGTSTPVDGSTLVDESTPVDEVGRLAIAFNEMTRRLRELVGSLEERVAQRTADLELQSAQLRTAAHVARLAASIREIDELLRVAASQIGEQFGFYHVGIYLRDDARRALVLRAASSGGALLERGFRLELISGSDHISRKSIIVDVAQSGQPSIVQDVAQDARYLAIAELPDTRSEMSLPLRVRGEVIGVLDVQSTEVGVFSGSDTAYLGTLADQLSLAIENARLFSEAEQRLREIGRLIQVDRQEGWREMLAGDGVWSYVYDGVEARRVAELEPWSETADLELPVGGATGSASEPLGVARVRLGAGRELAQGDVGLARAIVAEAAQALERATLFGGTQRALLEADTLYRSGRAIVEAGSRDEVLSALADYVVAPGIDRIVVLMFRQGAEHTSLIEVASVWTGSPDGRALHRGERWGIEQLPLLAPFAAGDGAAAGSWIFEDIATASTLDSASRDTLRGALGLRSALVLPLRTGSEPMGCLLIGATESLYAFSAQDVRMYQGLAEQAAPVLRSFELLELATRRAERERSISAIGESIRRFTDIEAILQTSVRELGRTLGASEGVIRLHPGGLTHPRSAGGSTAEGVDPGNGAEKLERESNATAEEL
jgi:GAF domain-containing protein/HAMP domain-containing protein